MIEEIATRSVYTASLNLPIRHSEIPQITTAQLDFIENGVNVLGMGEGTVRLLELGAGEGTARLLELHSSEVFDPENLTDVKQNGERLFYPLDARARAAAEDSVDHRRCAFCHADLAEMAKRKKCGRCKRCQYCGPACQKTDWHFHKLCCKA